MPNTPAVQQFPVTGTKVLQDESRSTFCRRAIFRLIQNLGCFCEGGNHQAVPVRQDFVITFRAYPGIAGHEHFFTECLIFCSLLNMAVCKENIPTCFFPGYRIDIIPSSHNIEDSAGGSSFLGIQGFFDFCS